MSRMLGCTGRIFSPRRARTGVPIALPPLRERPGEILPLARHFLAEACADEGLPVIDMSDDAEDALVGHAWSSNARERRNVMHRAALIGA